MQVKVTSDQVVNFLVKSYKKALQDENFLKQEKARLGVLSANVLLRRYRALLEGDENFLCHEFAIAIGGKISVKSEYPVCILDGDVDEIEEASINLSHSLMRQIDKQI